MDDLSVPMLMEHDHMSGDEGGLSDMLLPAIRKPAERIAQQRRLLRHSSASKEPAGELLITLTYQPSSARMNVTVVRGKCLPSKDMMRSSELFCQLLLFCDGRKVEHRKTVARRQSHSPQFNESFVFAVPDNSADILAKVNLVVAVLERDAIGTCKELGHAVLGVMAYAESNGTRHWKDAVSTASQRPTSMWHKLFRNKSSH